LADVLEAVGYDGWDFCGKNCREDYQAEHASSPPGLEIQPAKAEPPEGRPPRATLPKAPVAA